MACALLGLGANLGDRRRSLAAAVDALAAHPQIFDLRTSSLHETRAIGGLPDQPRFLNAVIRCQTSMAPAALHAACAFLEDQLGRRRQRRWEARVIDIDLLLYDDVCLENQQLILPHPRLAFRRFVLEPAAEVAADMVHPRIGWTIERLLSHLDTAPSYVAILGLPGTRPVELAAKTAAALGGRCIADVPREPPATAGNPPVHAWERQIQLLDRRTALLDAGAWTEPPVAALSDFYFDDCLAYARLELADETYQVFERAWSTARQRVVNPKLLVVLADPACMAEEPSGPTTLKSEMLSLSARRGLGPVLFAGAEFPRQQAEVTAAIAAMCRP